MTYKQHSYTLIYTGTLPALTVSEPYNMYMTHKTRTAYRQALAWIGFACLWLLMPAVIIWAIINLFV